MTNPFPLPDKLSPGLQRVFSYWESLKRADNSMPFWDDFKPSALPDLGDRLLLLDVTEAPERFRINTIGKEVGDSDRLRGKFIDETERSGRMQLLCAQASATVETRAPTGFEGDGYARLLLPMWGDGRIGMLLGAVEPR